MTTAPPRQQATEIGQSFPLFLAPPQTAGKTISPSNLSIHSHPESTTTNNAETACGASPLRKRYHDIEYFYMLTTRESIMVCTRKGPRGGGNRRSRRYRMLTPSCPKGGKFGESNAFNARLNGSVDSEFARFPGRKKKQKSGGCVRRRNLIVPFLGILVCPNPTPRSQG